MKRLGFIFWVCCICIGSVLGQDQNLTVQQLMGTHIDTVLKHHLAGEGVEISNGLFNNHSGNINSNQIGLFQRNGFTNFPFSSGLVMCTGGVLVAAGPNGSASASVSATSSYTESALQALSSFSVYDCASLEFDFLTKSDTFVFRYVFASEEYCEYVNSQYNDIFAFFLTGPDPVTHVTTTRNIAIIPGSISAANPDGIPVAINNVNHGDHSSGLGPGNNPSYPEFFIHNASTTGTQFDGYTTALGAGGPIMACTNYHMKLAICDASDGAFDSGVFLEENSFESTPDPSLSMNGFYCLHDDIVFQYDAQNVDSIHIVTPSGDTLWTPPFVIYNALEADTGWYFLRAKKGVSCNGDMWSRDSIHIEIHVPCVSELCNGVQCCAGEVLSFPYAYDSIIGPWVNYVNNNMFTISPPGNLPADTAVLYSLSMYDQAGCHFDTAVTVTVYARRHTDYDTSVCVSILWNGVTYTQSGEYDKILTSAAGCDSVVTLHLTVNPVLSGVDIQTACNSFVWIDGNTYTESDSTAQFTLTSVLGCDSLVTLDLTVNYTTYSDTTVIACDSFYWHGINYTQSGNYDFYTTNAVGCDSVETLHLTVNYTTFGDTVAVACDSFPWRGTIYTQSGDYTSYQTNATGCDSVVTLHLTVNYTTFGDTVAVACDSFPWRGTTYTQSGSYISHQTNVAGCDSVVTLHLTVNYTTFGDTVAVACDSFPWRGNTYTQSGDYTSYQTNVAGCDSVVTLHLTVNYTTFGDTTAVACDSFPWRGTTYTQSGNYIAHQTNAVGCDSVVTLHLTVNYTTFGDTTAVACDSFPWRGTTYTQSGNYIAHQTNSTGCDSIVTLHLTVNYTTFGDTVAVACDSFPWRGTTYTQSGNYTSYETNSTGCDSIVTLHLTVNHTTYGDTVAVACDSFPWHGATYTQSGNYTSYETNSTGCDSVVSLHLTVNHTTYGDTIAVACDSFPWRGTTYTQSGNYTSYQTNAIGCDSVVTLHLTVNHTTFGDTVAVACDSFPWRGITYTQSGNYTAYQTNAVGCDSIVTLHLTVNPTTFGDTVAIACDSFPWRGTTYTQSGSYIAHQTNAVGCDSIVTLYLTVNYTTFGDTLAVACDSFPWRGTTYTQSGDYTSYQTNAVGCDSIVTLHLTVNYTTFGDTVAVACDSFPWRGTTYTQSGNYTSYQTNAIGCDSVVTLHLTVNPTTFGDTVAVVCDSFPWRGTTYTQSGNYTSYQTNAIGCDSVVTLHLTVNSTTFGDTVAVACDSFPWRGTTYTQSGNYTSYQTNATGCDSIVTLHLTVNHTTFGDTVAVACDSFPWRGTTYMHSGSYIAHQTNSTGCDSIVTLHLTVNHTTFGDTTAVTCDSFSWRGTTYTQSGNYIAHQTNAVGCDSVVTLLLTVNHPSESTLNTSVAQNNLPFTLNGDSYAAPGTYYQHFTNAVGCDSILTINLTVYYNVTTQVDTTVCATDMPYTWHGHTFTAAGSSYTDTLLTSHGADSTVTYTISVNNISAGIGNVTHIICYGDSTGAATATVTGGQSPMTYTWTNAAGASVSAATSMNQLPAGAYTFTVTDQIGCLATATVTLNTLNAELVPGTITDNQDVCDGEDVAPFTGTAASGGDNGAYQWQISANGTDWATAPGTANAQDYTYPNLAASTFMLRRAWVSQSCGTVYSNTVTVSVWHSTSDTIVAGVCQDGVYQEYGFDITEDQTATAGEYTFEAHYSTGHCDSAITLLLTVYPTYEVALEDEVCEGSGYNENGFHVQSGETVGAGELDRVLHLQSGHGCDSTVMLHLSVIDTALRIVSLTEDFCEEMSAELTVVTGLPDYVWNTGETAPTITVTAPGIYAVTASQDGCSATATIRVVPCQNTLDLPNAITPSRGDGLNDYFYIPERNQQGMNDFEIFIYNRWGELVFYSTDKNFRWNGEYRGQIQHQTIYNYVIRYIDASGHPRMKQGFVTVL